MAGDHPNFPLTPTSPCGGDLGARGHPATALHGAGPWRTTGEKFSPDPVGRVLGRGWAGGHIHRKL